LKLSQRLGAAPPDPCFCEFNTAVETPVYGYTPGFVCIVAIINLWILCVPCLLDTEANI